MHERKRGTAGHEILAENASYSNFSWSFERPPMPELQLIFYAAEKARVSHPRVAYLCRLYAYHEANKLDPRSIRLGVREFKTKLSNWLDKANGPTTMQRIKESDASEIRCFIEEYLAECNEAMKNAEEAGQADRSHCIGGYDLGKTLDDVLEFVWNFNAEIEETHNKLAKWEDTYEPYNILPLDPNRENMTIMRYPEIQAAVLALRNNLRLPWPKDYYIKKPSEDILDFLQCIFGFQKDNVANQREHLILLLANVHIRQHRPSPDQESVLDERAIGEVMKKLFNNYEKWCKFLGRQPNHWMLSIGMEKQQRMLLYISLYLLIWGEAANLRLMPECLSYIYHHMVSEVNSILAGNVDMLSNETVKPAYGGENEAFLNKVVKPIYQTISREAEKSRKAGAKHSQWRNYDDLNEYFWSVDCFRLGWPMRADADFFCQPQEVLHTDNNHDSKSIHSDQSVPKINFVEIRSYWHIFRSFDRMWTFFILCLQVMIILAWNGAEPSRKISSIFLTAASLNFGQAIVDVFMSWDARNTMSLNLKFRYILKVLSSAAWVLVFSVTYSHSSVIPSRLAGLISSVIPSGLARLMRKWMNDDQDASVLYPLAVLIYLSPSVFAALLFPFPFIRRIIEKSNRKISMILMWWSQSRIFVGRGMHESFCSLFKYTLFWVLLLILKLVVSYYIEIKPLVESTKSVMNVGTTYEWHQLFWLSKNNIGLFAALWAPVILVYFMDTQIWYAFFCTICGGLNGAFLRVGEIRTLGMLRSRFQSLPRAFNERLIPSERRKGGCESGISSKFNEIRPSQSKEVDRFVQLWNKIIQNFRNEDLISDREMDLLLATYWESRDLNIIQWPLFLLAGKIPIALDMAKDCEEPELKKRILADTYMHCAVQECYACFKNIIECLVAGELETEVVKKVFDEVEKHIIDGTLASGLVLKALPCLYKHLVKLIHFLMKNKEKDRVQVVLLLQDILKDVTNEPLSRIVLKHCEESYARYEPMAYLDENFELFAKPGGINFPMKNRPELLQEKIRRLYTLLTLEEDAADEVPSNLEAKRRILFFANSLFMDMPSAPNVRDMLSFSVLTPYYKEEVLFSSEDLKIRNEDGISIIFYLQKMYPDEWINFLERTGCKTEDELTRNQELNNELKLWASYRGQTLTRTVRGMMYYWEALELQAIFDIADEEEAGIAQESLSLGQRKVERSLRSQARALADIKFTYVVSCQHYGIDKRCNNRRARDIQRLMTKYPSLRVAYIDEVEPLSKDKEEKTGEKLYYSVLVKANIANQDIIGDVKRYPMGLVQNFDQVIYRIRLPGPPILGEGKPENQNHSIIFTRGEGLQTIDMNQDNYLEEAFKMRNLLQEFRKKQGGLRYPSILGFREHIFTGSISSLAWFMSNQETTFVTIGQRPLANPLRVRFHYGHPDVFDRIFHLTRGGISKASKMINLSEDIFAGFNSILRGGSITHHEYIQVGKGRDVGLNEISQFEAKIARGNGEQTLSRDVYRLAHRFDFFRMLSYYFTTVGFYVSSMITILTLYVFIYGRLYLAFSGLEEGLNTGPIIRDNKPLQAVLASQFWMQLGLFVVFPWIMQTGLEEGFWNAIIHFLLMQLQLAAVFFTFSLGTKFHYYGRTLLHGGAQYSATGRGFVVFHAKFVDNYRLYSRSHFVKAFEIGFMLVVYFIVSHHYRSTTSYILTTHPMWFLALTWLFAPTIFNPCGFEWQKIVDDWSDWSRWINHRGGIGVGPEKSWESWWEKEQEYLQFSGKIGKCLETLLALRFFIFQFGLIYHLNISKGQKIITAYGISWLLFVIILAVTKVFAVERRNINADYRRFFRLFKSFIFVACVVLIIIMTLCDMTICLLACLPMGWGLVQIARAWRPIFERLGIWDIIRTFAHGHEIIMGLILFVPIAFLGWFPFISEFQTRMLFNQAFNKGVQIQRIFRALRRNTSPQHND